ncbi:hypothetical protein N7475_004325 [Penicillium sp. IBT 31633x]|nr:hypothetical protein N7475_004325 [Penicillium sp. IBT 31633x]
MDSAKQPGGSHPQWNVLCCAPGSCPPDPESIDERANDESNMLNPGRVTIRRLSPDMVVKYGSFVTVTEAQSMIYVAERTQSIPVPKVFANCTHGPLDRDLDDYGSLFDTYIFMSLVDGQTLDLAWDSYDELTKIRISNQLRTYMDEVREIKNEPYIGSVNKGPVIDQIFDNFHIKGFPALALTPYKTKI